MPLKNPHQTVPLDRYTTNLEAMIKIIRKYNASTRILVISPPPLDCNTWGEHCVAKGRELDRSVDRTKLFRDGCIATCGSLSVPCIDTWKLFMPPGGEYNLNLAGPFLSDGLHFSSKGNELLARALVDCIRRNWPDLDPETMQSPVKWWDKINKEDINGSLMAGNYP